MKPNTLKETGIWIGALGLAAIFDPVSASNLLINTAARIGAGALGRQLDKMEIWQREELNHDLQKALVFALHQTLDDIQQKYYQKHVALLNILHRNKVNNFFHTLKTEIAKELNITASEEKIKKLLEEQTLDNIAPHLLDQLCSRAKAYSPKLSDIFRQNFVGNIPKFFKEALKDPQHEKAWKAFWMNCFQTIDEKQDQSLDAHQITHNKQDQSLSAQQIIYDKLDALPQKDGTKPIPVPLTQPAPSVPEFFRGRANDLQQITQHLAAKKDLLLLNGTGGVGKSTIAAAYWHEHKQTYDNYAWVTVPPTASLEEAFLNLSILPQSLQIAPTVLETKKRWQLLLQALASLQGNNLLVIDNVNKAADLQRIKREMSFDNFTKLLTSRKHLDYFPTYPIEALSMEAAKQLFCDYYPPAQEQDALLIQLLERIECHTLSIEVLAKNLRAAKRYTLQNLYDDLADKGILQLSQARKVRTDYHPEKISPQELLLKMFDIRPLSDTEQWLLLQLAVLPPLAISYDFLMELLGMQQTNLEETADDLVEKGWLAFDAEEESYKLHPIIQEVIREKVGVSYEKCKGLVEFFIAKMTEKYYENPLRAVPYVPYANSLLKYITEEHEGIVALANNLALIYKYLGDLNKALKFQLKVNNIHENVLDPMHPDLAVSYNNLALIYQELGDLNKALSFQRKSVNIREKIYGQCCQSIVIGYNNISLIYQELGDLNKALAFQLKIINILKRTYDQQNPYFAVFCNNISNIYQGLEDFENALKFQLEAKNIQEATQEPNHPELATCYNNLYGIYHDLGDLENALKFQLKAIEIREKIYDNNHSHLGISYVNLATLYIDLKKLPLAKKYIDQAVAIFQHNFPNGHPHLTEALKWQKRINNLLG